MSEQSIKDQAIDAIDAEQSYWRSIVERVDQENRTGVIVAGDWDFRDLVAHLLTWREFGLNSFEIEAAGGVDPGYPWPEELTKDDDINVWLHQRDLDVPVDKLIADYDDSLNRLRALVSALPESELVDPDRFTMMQGEAIATSLIDGSFFTHLHDEHGQDIESFLQSISTTRH